MEGHLVGWALGLGFFKKKMAQPGDGFAPWGPEASLGSLCVEPGVKSNVTRGIQNPTSLWGGAGAGQQDVTLGSSHRWMRAAWAGTECGMTPKLKDRGSCDCLGWILEVPFAQA